MKNKIDLPMPDFKLPILSNALFKTNANQEDLNTENRRLKRELEVREKAIKDLEMKIEDEHVPKKAYESEVQLREKYLDKFQLAKNLLEKSEADYHKEHSLAIQLDGEVENLREQLRQSREESVKYGKENEHLWGLLKIKMEG
jgi:deoxyadenosine/deoxycytidine kinase